MNFIDLNKFGGIGANSTYIKLGSFNILIDSGLHPKKTGKEALPDFSLVNGEKLDYIILTHCHLDHLGSLPIIASNNPDAKVLTAIPNKYLAPRMLRNSINVMKKQREEFGLLEYPLYSYRELDHLKRAIIPLAFKKSEFLFKNRDKLEVKLHNAGHVVGASAIELIHNKERILFSGDVLFDDQRTLAGAELPTYKIDTLFLETTRGETQRPTGTSRDSEIEELINNIKKIINNGGSCLVPVFALGRMQELFKLIHESIEDGTLKKIPVYSKGLGMDICNYFDKINKSTGLVNFHSEILNSLNVKPPEQKLRPGRDIKKKGIYILSSGMLIEKTPSYNIAASLLAHESNGIFFIGYCDPDTPGGKLINKKSNESFFFNSLDYLCPVRASIKKFDLSGHADRDSLVEYAINSKAKNIILNHGDVNARNWFKDRIKQINPSANLLDPKPGLKYTI